MTTTRQPLDIQGLAHAYKWLVLWFGLQLVLGVARPLLEALFASTDGALGLLLVFDTAALLVTIGALTYYAYRAAQALRSRVPLVWAVAILVPLVNAITLDALSLKATRACRANGVEVGLLGPRLAVR